MFGSPEITEPITHLGFDRSHRYLAAVSASTLSIWSGRKHRVLLSHHRRDADDDAHNLRVLWRPNSAELAVLTSDGALLYYSLLRSGAAPPGVEPATLQFRHEGRLPSGFIACACSDARGGGIVCGTSSGEVLRITWMGEVGCTCVRACVRACVWDCTRYVSLTLRSALKNISGETQKTHTDLETLNTKRCKQVSLRVIVSDGNKYTVASKTGSSFKGGSGSVRERLESPHRHAQRVSSSSGHGPGDDVVERVARITMAEVEASQPVEIEPWPLETLRPES